MNAATTSGRLNHDQHSREDGLHLSQPMQLHEQLDRPTISIITVVWNGATTLERTIRSVLNQTYKNIQHVVIDGGSTDGTLDILRAYDDSIAIWLSEQDRGIYDAMNKGTRLSTGDWLLYLGADDWLHDEQVIEKIVPALSGDCMAVFGNTIYDDETVIRSTLGPMTLLHNTVQHQSAFYNRALFKNFTYDTAFRINADYELNLITYLHKAKWKRVDMPVSFCAKGGVSTSPSWRTRGIKELNMIRNRHVNSALGSLLTLYLNFRLAIRLMYWKLRGIQ